MTGVTRARTALTPRLAEIQAPVRVRLDAVSEEIARIVTADLPVIEEVNNHLLLMKGKMFRPTLTLLASAVEEAPEERAALLGAVIELVHLATLVHDDAVDHSALRRGMPTINSLFSHQISVIMGDFLYSRAVVELVRHGDLEVLRVIAHATNAMTVGEMRQLTAHEALDFGEEDYEALIRAKTASLLSAACEIGALSGARAWRGGLRRYGEALGMAFQVADDLLDYTADATVIGKPSGLDLREHKVTLPLISALRRASGGERRIVEELFATPEPAPEQVAEVVELVTVRGGIEYARRRAEEYASSAEQALEGLPDTVATSALHDAIGYAVDRSR